MEGAEEILRKMTVAELRRLASEGGISLKNVRKKQDIIETILNSEGIEELLAPYSGDKGEEDASEDAHNFAVESDTAAGRETSSEVEVDTAESTDSQDDERLMDEEEISKKLEDARNTMLDFNTLLQYVQTLPRTYENREYALAMYQVKAADRISERVFSGWHSWAAAWMITASERIIEELESTGYGMGKERRLLEVARRDFAGENQESMKESAAALQESVSKAFERRIADLDERLTQLEVEITKMNEIGAKTSDAERLLLSARSMLLKYNHLGVEKKLLEAESSLEIAKGERIQQINDYLPRVESLIEDGKSLGADMSEAEHLLNLARESLSREDYLMTIELLGKAEASALEGQEEQVKKAMNLRMSQIARATEIINYNEPFVDEAIAYGLDVQNSRQIIEQARAALSGDDYVEGLRLANELKRIVAAIKPDILSIRSKKGITIPVRGKCSRCGSDRLSFSDNGTGVCENCGHTFKWLRLQPSAPSVQQSVSPSPSNPAPVNICPKCGTPMNTVMGVGLVCPNCGFTQQVKVKKKRHFL